MPRSTTDKEEKEWVAMPEVLRDRPFDPGMKPVCMVPDERKDLEEAEEKAEQRIEEKTGHKDR